MTSEASPILLLLHKIQEGRATLEAFHEALTDLVVITETLLEDLDVAMKNEDVQSLLRRAAMDEAWDRVLP